MTVYGIETLELDLLSAVLEVATVLTVYGIETLVHATFVVAVLELQQYLPFTVLKPDTQYK